MIFDPEDYGREMESLIRDERLSELGPGRPNEAAHAVLQNASIESLFEHATVCDRDMGACCLSAVWLYHDFLDESHTISQGIDTVESSYWHGIMHRREPDAGNSKYWFRRVGSHEAFDDVCETATALALSSTGNVADTLKSFSSWDPFGFIDLCESSRGQGDENETLCKRVQLAEWRILFDFCYRRAIGE